MLTQQQSEAIDFLIEGNNKSDTAKLVGVSRNTIYDWLKNKEFVEEKTKRIAEVKKSGRDKLVSKLGSCMDIIYKIATTSKDTRTQFQAAKYICDQLIGSPTAIREPENNDKEIVSELTDIDEMLAEIKKDNNIEEGKDL